MSDADRFFRALEEGEVPAVIAVGGPERAFVDDALRIAREARAPRVKAARKPLRARIPA